MELKLVFEDLQEINRAKSYFRHLLSNKEWYDEQVSWYNTHNRITNYKCLDEYLRIKAIDKCVEDKLGVKILNCPQYIKDAFRDSLFDIYNTMDIIEDDGITPKPKGVKVIDKITVSNSTAILYSKWRFLI